MKKKFMSCIRNKKSFLPVMLIAGLLAAGLLFGCTTPEDRELQFTVTFMPNGADGGAVPAPITRAQGTLITIPGNTGALTLENHYFDGWNTQPDGSGIDFAPGFEGSLNENLTLYAQWSEVQLPQYTITFIPNEADDGTVPAPITRAQGTEVTIPGNTGGLTRDNHYFDGWNTQADGSGTPFPADKQYTITGNLTLYAHWQQGTPPQYTVTFMENGADGGTVPAPITGAHGSLQTIPGNTGALTLANHNFDGWNTQADGSGTAFAANAQHTLVANLTLYAQWVPEQQPTEYTITFMPNGADGGTVPNPITEPHGTPITIPGNTGALTLANHNFNGWNTAANGSGTAFAANAQHTLVANLTLYAQWVPGQQPTEYTITFMPNGATGGTVPEPITGAPGSTVGIPPNVGAISRVGHQWGHWNTEPDGSGTAFRAGDQHTLTGNLTLYTRWWPENSFGSFSVTFLPNGATSGNAPNPRSFFDGTTITIPGNERGLVMTGYRFNGWNTAADGSGTAYPVGATHRIFNPLVLHAQWEAGAETMVTVTYDPNGGIGAGPPPQTVPRGMIVVNIPGPMGFTKAGHGFTNWNTAADGSGTAFGMGPGLQSQLTVDADITLYAQWAAMVTITFHANGGTGTVPSGPGWTATVGTIRTVPCNGINNDTIVRPGYSFDRWNTASDGSGTDYVFLRQITFTTDLTLYARWEPLVEWKMVSAAQNHNLAIRTDGSLWAWGGHATGASGLGLSEGWALAPTRVGTHNDWVYVSSATNHSLGIRADGSLWAWGTNMNGRTGFGVTAGNTVVPTLLCDDHEWKSVSAGDFHSLAIREDGSLWAWGYNGFGRTGLGVSTGSTLVPTRVGTDNNWASVSAGGFHSLAIREDGSLWAWGDGWDGALGLGAAVTGDVLEPTRVGDDNNWRSVSAGWSHSLAVRTNGQLWAWGSNTNGRTGLGIGATMPANPRTTPTPTQVGSDTNWESVAAGHAHSLGVRTDGTLWSWGYNGSGRTGRNTQIGNQTTPAQVGNDTNWVSVSAGATHSAGIRTIGTIDTLWAWGANSAGRTGQNTATGNSLNPVQIVASN